MIGTKKENLKKIQNNLFYIFIAIILVLYVSLMLYMIGWGLINTFKTKTEFRTNILGLPKNWTFNNYRTASENLYIKIEHGTGFRYVFVEEMFLNSLLYAGGCAFFTAASQCVTAYIVRQFPCKFSSLLYAIVIATMLIPIVGSDASLMVVLTSLGLYDTLFGAWFMKSYFIGMYFLVFHATFSKLPKSYMEAASIDGAGNMRIFLTIILPLVKGMFFTMFLLNFIGYWNDYQVPMLYLPSMPTIAYGVYSFSMSVETHLSSLPMKLTGCMLMLLPILIVFSIFNKRLMKGVAVGGLKE